mgnify:CR=1 FL=1
MSTRFGSRKAPAVGIDNPGFPRLVGKGSFWSASLGLGVEL